MSNQITLIESDSISRAWLNSFQALLERGRKSITPLTVSISVDPNIPIDDMSIRIQVNSYLEERGRYSIDTTANTIFPSSLWNPEKDRNLLYSRYRSILQELKRMAPENRNGLYFERLIKYGSYENDELSVNQLEHIIQTYNNNNHRPTALQASIFDPRKDHSHQRRRGFPCLQHVIFSPTGNGGLSISGVYASQFVFDRAYGNYLGLYRLGSFMACEMGLTLNKVICFVTKAQLGSITKESGRSFYDRIAYTIS